MNVSAVIEKPNTAAGDRPPTAGSCGAPFGNDPPLRRRIRKHTRRAQRHA
jgi:hypothetical protein